MIEMLNVGFAQRRKPREPARQKTVPPLPHGRREKKGRISMKKLISMTLMLALLLSIVPCGCAFGETAAAGDEYPVRFDLRDNGVVTPVKIQEPWGSCWAFASIAAAETSILSMLKEKGRAIDAKKFNLSEKHLIWYGTNPITEAIDPAQAGEGMFITGKDDNSYTTSLYSNGGYGLNTSTLFASGVGPVLEKYFPYQGDSGLTEKEYLIQHPDAGETKARDTFEEQTGMTPEQFVADANAESAQSYLRYLRKNGYITESDNSKLTVKMLVDASLQVYVALFAKDNQYTKQDDWTIPETMIIDGQTFLNRNISSGYTMVDGNKLPSLFLKDADGKWAGINEEGILAVKSELMKGHGVSAGFQADVSQPGQEGQETYMSLSNYAHYTYEDKGTSHMICIVGWDDNFGKENFLRGTPPGNGAWLVKNSWGSETDYVTNANGKDIGKSVWGIENGEGETTGYFWISYYDKSLNYCESMSFDTDLTDVGGELIVKMYDYMPSLIGVRTGQGTDETSASVLKTANVFTNDTGLDAHLYSVSTKTAHPNAAVTYSVYRLNDGFRNPEDGELLGTATASYDYAGFHREKLDGSIVIGAGESFAVVAEETVVENGETLYEYAANISYSKAHAEAVKAAEAENGISSDNRDRNADEYGVAVVNKGESFIYDNGAWTDWTEYEPRTRLLDDYAIDNFSIKAYMTVKISETEN